VIRVLMVSDVYFPRVNGVSSSMETFRRALATHDVEVRLVVPRYADEPDEPGVTRVPGRRLPNDPEDRLASWRGMRDAARRAAAECHLVHIQTPFVAHYAGLAAARHHGLPVLTTYHTLFEEYLHHYVPLLPPRWLRALARRFSRHQCNAVDEVIVPSSAMAERLARYGVTAPLRILPTGIPLDRYARGDGAAFRAARGIAPDRPLALFVGRVAHEKNIGFLLEALVHARQHCPEAQLLVTGEGPAMADLRQQAETLGLADAVRFLGYLDRARELPDCYAAADVFVFASRTETQGLVLLEAMAAGLPVIALSAMGTGDVLADAPGAIVPPDDPAAFGDALGRFLAGRQVGGPLADQARQTARRWSDGAMAERLADCYRQVLAPCDGLAAPTSAPPRGAGARAIRS
jgi:glycosyltransferase involved in cell wall biosynthesis